MYDFIVPVVDTDAITVCKRDQSMFSTEEVDKLTEELNSLFDEYISWEFEFTNTLVIALKAKNYVLYDGKKIKYKGSALKSSQLEIALREFLEKIIDAIIFEKYNYKEIYESYVKEILEMKDIKRWASKKTISEKTLTSERTNEARIRQAIEGTEYKEGDKVWVYFLEDGNLNIVEKFNNDCDKIVMLKKLYNTCKRFKPIMNIDEHFINYSLKKNQKMIGL